MMYKIYLKNYLTINYELMKNIMYSAIIPHKVLK